MALFLAACDEQPATDEEPLLEAIDPGTPEIYGCLSLRGDSCLLLAGGENPIGVWVDVAPDTRVRVTIDGVASESRTRVADGGLHATVAVPASATVVTIAGADPRWTREIAISVERMPSLPVIAESRKLQIAGDLDGARRLLNAYPASDPQTRMRIHDQLRVYAQGAGDGEEVLRQTAVVVELADAHDYPGHLANASLAAFYQHYTAGELARAREWADRTASSGTGAPMLSMISAYEEGLLSSASGDADRAERSFASVSRIAERAGNSEYVSAALQMRTVVLAELGRAEEARAVATDAMRYASDAATSCNDRLRILDNVAWASIRLAQGGLEWDPPFDMLEQMRDAAAADGECPEPDFYDDARINLAFAWLVEDEPELAYELAADLVAMHAPTADPWVEELAATTALATGRWAEVPELLPARAVEPWLEWLGAVRYAESLERSGLDEAAIDAWIALEQRLDRAVRQVGVAAEQERFLAGRSISAQRLVDLLLRDGHDDAAMCRARLAIARAVQAADRNARVAALTPAQRASWDAEIERYQALRSENEKAAQGEWVLPAEELERVRMRRAEKLAEADARIDALLGISPAPADCARLTEPSAKHPLVVAFEGADDVIVFVADDARVHTLRVPLDATPDSYAAALAQPFAGLADAERVTVLASGVATAIPFHALVHDGATLLPDTPIAYGLDLLSRPAAIDDGEPAAALIVADPRGDLSAAAEEAAIVEQRLRDASWQVVVRRGEEATREALLAGLAEASLFHYAGHGSRGVAAWDAALRLAGDTELRVGDVLAIPKVPANVVLAGCHTGRRDDASLAGGMSLGRAFVLAGADAALVADAEVDDAATRALTEALYRDPTLALPTALRRAQAQLRNDGIADWSSFRVVVR